MENLPSLTCFILLLLFDYMFAVVRRFIYECFHTLQGSICPSRLSRGGGRRSNYSQTFQRVKPKQIKAVMFVLHSRLSLWLISWLFYPPLSSVGASVNCSSTQWVTWTHHKLCQHKRAQIGCAVTQLNASSAGMTPLLLLSEFSHPAAPKAGI